MKNLLLISILFFFQLPTKASHVIGGEITWECSTNGTFKFKMHIYADPNGIPYNFTTESILVSGAVLPSSNNGTPITSITM